MRASDLSPVPGSVHKKKRIGRGNASGHGTYSTRGLKGQQSRSGRDLRIGFEGGQNPLVRALSRKRGFNNRFRVEYETINVSDLAKLPAKSTVTSESLRAAGIVKSARKPVKLLGAGEIGVALTVEVEKLSATAIKKIEAAGGKATALTPAKQKPEVEPEPPVATPVAESPVVATAEAPVAAAPSEPAEEPTAEAKPARRPRAPRAKAAAEGETVSETPEN
jgi:large subunit ribosomal protein L15